MTNPYLSTSRESASVKVGTASVMVVSIALTLLSALTIILESLLIVLPMAYFLVTTILNTPGFKLSMISGWGYIAIGALVFTAHWLILFGSICMWRKLNYRFAVVATVLSIVPVLSPFYLLGMPFGIWGVIALAHPRSRAAFAPVR